MAKQSRIRDYEQFIVRLPPGLRDRIKAAADANNQSMNAEIVATLLEAYPDTTFDLNAFWQTWMNRIIDAPDAEKDALVEKANEELSARMAGMTIWLMQVSDRRMPVIAPNEKFDEDDDPRG